MKKPAPDYDNEKDIGKLERLVKAKTRAVEDLEKKVAWEESLAVGEMGLMATSQEIDLDVASGESNEPTLKRLRILKVQQSMSNRLWCSNCRQSQSAQYHPSSSISPLLSHQRQLSLSRRHPNS